MKITGPEVDLFVEIDPNLEQFVTEEKKKQVLYVQLDKALYMGVFNKLCYGTSFIQKLYKKWVSS